MKQIFSIEYLKKTFHINVARGCGSAFDKAEFSLNSDSLDKLS